MFVVPGLEDDLRSIGQDILASYERKLQEGDLRNAKVLLQKGDAAQRIIETANIEECGLIVIGSRGRRLQRIIARGRKAQSDKSRRLPSLGSEIMCSTNLYNQDQSDLACLQYLETGRALLPANLVP